MNRLEAINWMYEHPDKIVTSPKGEDVKCSLLYSDVFFFRRIDIGWKTVAFFPEGEWTIKRMTFDYTEAVKRLMAGKVVRDSMDIKHRRVLGEVHHFTAQHLTSEGVWGTYRIPFAGGWYEEDGDNE